MTHFAKVKVVRVADSWQVPNVATLDLERSIDAGIATLNFSYQSATELSEGDTIDAYIDFYAGSWTKVFRGQVTAKSGSGERNKALKITARDALYNLRRGNIAKQYSLVTLGAIIKDIVSFYSLGFGTTHVADIAIVDKVNIADRPPLEGINTLREAFDVFMWVQANLDLYWIARGTGAIIESLTELDVKKFTDVKKEVDLSVRRVVISGGHFQGIPIRAIAEDGTATEEEKTLGEVPYYRPDIDDPALAQNLANAKLNSFKTANIQLSFEKATPSDLYAGCRLTCTFPSFSISGTFDVLKVKYSYSDGQLKEKITVGVVLKGDTNVVADVLSRLAVLEAARTSVADTVNEMLLGDAHEEDDIDFPIDPDVVSVTGGTDDIVRDKTDDNLVLGTGKTSGYFIVRFTPPYEAFLAWDRIDCVYSVGEGAVSVDLIDATNAIMFSGVTFPLSVRPYPPDLDWAEHDPAEWGGTNVSIKENSRNAVFGEYSMKAIFSGVSVERGLYYPATKDLAINLNNYRALKLSAQIDTPGSIEVRLHTDAGNYFKKATATFGTSWDDGRFSFPLIQTEWATVGTPSWSSITYFEFVILASDAAILETFLDGVRLERVLNEQVALRFTLTRPNAGDDSPRIQEILWAVLVGGK